jgi:hypothetical protein
MYGGSQFPVKRLFSRTGPWLFNLLLVLSSLIVGFLLTELVARKAPSLIVPGAMRTYSELKHLHQEEKKRLSSRYNVNRVHMSRPSHHIYKIGIPGIKYNYYGLDFTSQVEYNSLGIRDRESTSLTPQRPIALFLGDSFVEGKPVSFDLTMTRQLEISLQEKGKPWWVVNAGMGGTGTTNALHLLEYLGPIYRPQRVILLFFLGNDLRNNSLLLEAYNRASNRTNRGFYWKLNGLNSFQYLKPRCKISKILENNQYFRLQETIRSVKKCRNGCLLTRCIDRISGFSDACSLLQKRLGMDPTMRCLVKLNGVPLHLLFETDGSKQLQETAWEVTTFLLAQMKTVTAELGAEFLVLILPSRIHVEESVRDSTLRKYGIKATRLIEGGPQKRLASILDRLGISRHDLTESLRHYKGKEKLYLPIDGHFSSHGHRFIAELLAETF